MSQATFHTDFTLNGKGFATSKELLRFSSSLSKEAFLFLSAWFDTNDFIEVQTSGSTGTPTSISLKKEYMVNSAQATGAYFELPQKTTALLCLSPKYIAGKMMLVRAMVLGWALDMVEPASCPLDHTEKTYDFCAMVPLQLANSLSQLYRIKKLIVGGASVSNELIEKLQEFPTRVFATYGMTETITHVAIKKLNHLDVSSTSNVGFDCQPDNVIQAGAQPDIDVPSSEVEMLNNGSGERSYYNTLPNVKISTDTRGCLVIDAPGISDTKIITKDMVELISDTEFQWLGRYDTIINSGGIKLIPEQIEKKLAAVIDSRFFVAGIPDKLLGEKLVLIVESENSDDDILNKVKNLTALSKYEIPKKIFYIPEFIETGTKKIQRRQTLDLIFNK